MDFRLLPVPLSAGNQDPKILPEELMYEKIAEPSENQTPVKRNQSRRGWYCLALKFYPEDKNRNWHLFLNALHDYDKITEATPLFQDEIGPQKSWKVVIIATNLINSFNLSSVATAAETRASGYQRPGQCLEIWAKRHAGEELQTIWPRKAKSGPGHPSPMRENSLSKFHQCISSSFALCGTLTCSLRLWSPVYLS